MYLLIKLYVVWKDDKMKVFILVAYVVMMVAIIFITAKKSLSLKDFLLGGYNVGPWMSALSYGTGYFSAVIIVGYSGSVGWDAGIAAVWCGIGNALIGSLLAWKLIAKPTRIMGEHLKVSTIPSFFEKRYNSKFLRLLSAMIIFIFLIPYSASVYKGLGSMFKLTYGIDYTIAVIAIAILSSIYLFAGGYKATAVTDFIQGIIMIVGIVSVVIYIINGAGGLTEGLKSLADPKIGGNGFNSLIGPTNSRSFLLINVLLTSVGVLGMPQMVHKFFAIKDPKSVNIAAIISTVFALIIAGGAYFAGGFGRVIISKIDTVNGSNLFSNLNNGLLGKDTIMPTILTDTSVVGIPDALLGLFIVLLLSASISTLTSIVLSTSSVISIDLVSVLKPGIKKETTTKIMRILCIVFVVLSLIINFALQNTPIPLLMSLSWGTISGAFLAPFLYGLLWKGTTKIAAVSSVILGGLVSVIPPIIANDFSLAPYSGVLAIFINLVFVPLLSLATKKQSMANECATTVFNTNNY